jgi:hypothetical protein
MKARRALHIPVLLTWTAVSGATVLAVACSGESPQTRSSSPDSAVAPEPTAQDAAMAEDSRPSREASASDAPQDVANNADTTTPAVDCEEITDGSLQFFPSDSGTCPDGDLAVPVV